MSRLLAPWWGKGSNEFDEEFPLLTFVTNWNSSLFIFHLTPSPSTPVVWRRSTWGSPWRSSTARRLGWPGTRLCGAVTTFNTHNPSLTRWFSSLTKSLMGRQTLGNVRRLVGHHGKKGKGMICSCKRLVFQDLNVYPLRTIRWYERISFENLSNPTVPPSALYYLYLSTFEVWLDGLSFATKNF